MEKQWIHRFAAFLSPRSSLHKRPAAEAFVYTNLGWKIHRSALPVQSMSSQKQVTIAVSSRKSILKSREQSERAVHQV
jgi:hypothetical protein